MNIPSNELPSHRDLIAMAVLMEGGLGLVAIALGWLIGMNPLDLVAGDWWAILWGCLAALPLVGALVTCERFPFWPFSDVTDVVDRLIRPMFAKTSLVELAVISTLAGIGEELLFRGLLQEGLSRWIGPPTGVWVALATASILFGLLHPMNGAYILLAAVMGLVLGGLWIVSGNLLVPIVTHAVYDFVGLIWLVNCEGSIHGRINL